MSGHMVRMDGPASLLTYPLALALTLLQVIATGSGPSLCADLVPPLLYRVDLGQPYFRGSTVSAGGLKPLSS